MSVLRFSRLSLCLILTGSPMLHAAGDDTENSHELDTIDVVGASVDGYDAGMTTEGSGSYTSGASNTATRMVLSPRETPQSVTVITREQM